MVIGAHGKFAEKRPVVIAGPSFGLSRSQV